MIEKDIKASLFNTNINSTYCGVDIPQEKTDLVAGFNVVNTFTNLGGRYRTTFRPLKEAIISGRLRGIEALISCNTVTKPQDDSHLRMVKKLIANDVLVVMTGCAATACAKNELLQPESAVKWAAVKDCPSFWREWAIE